MTTWRQENSAKKYHPDCTPQTEGGKGGGAIHCSYYNPSQIVNQIRHSSDLLSEMMACAPRMLGLISSPRCDPNSTTRRNISGITSLPSVWSLEHAQGHQSLMRPASRDQSPPYISFTPIHPSSTANVLVHPAPLSVQL